MKRFLLLAAFALSFGFMHAQSTVSGTVTDSDSGDPLEGVAVVVKGTTIGILTDDEGKYRLDVPADASVLMFTYVGKSTEEVDLSGQSTVNIRLRDDALSLDEVVVTALGIPREQRSLTSAVQEVDGQALVNSRETNVVSSLSGKIAGVQVTAANGSPGGASNIVIRGNASLTGSNQPLFVIDGVPVDNSQIGNAGDQFDLLGGATFSNRAVDINPEDIADISVLKGPAAAALYGSRAGNGVILITTKKGGSGKKGIGISYNTAVSFDQVNQLPELNTRYAQGFNGALAGRISTSWGPELSTLSYDGDQTSDYDVNGNLVDASDPSATGVAARSYDRADYFQTGFKWDNNVTMSGGDRNNNFIVSVSNTDQKGVVPNSSLNRTTVRAAGQTALGNKLDVSSSITYTYNKTRAIQGGSNVNGVMLGLLRTPPSFDNNFGFSKVSDEEGQSAYRNADGTQRNYRGGGGYDNPHWASWQNPLDQTVNRINGYVKLSYQPLTWLNISYRAGVDSWSDFRKQIFALNSSGGKGSGSVEEQNSRWFEFNSDLFVTADYQFTEDFKGELLLGNNLNHRFSQTVFTQGNGLNIPDFYNISNASSISATEGNTTVRLAGLFFRLNLAYKNMLYLEVSGRNDWASTFGQNNNNFFYPSASVGWVFTETFGMADNAILPFGKIRLSYAEAGKEPGAYLLNNTFSPVDATNPIGQGFITGVSGPFLGQTLFTQSTGLANPDLLPEKTSTIEVGADLRFWNGRISLDVTYYNSVSEGQIIGVQIPATTGFFSTIQNAGTVENNGIEAILDFDIIRSKDFRWNLMVNYSRNRSLVKELAKDLEFISLGQNFGSVSNQARVGSPYGVLFGGVFEKTSDGRYVIDDATGYPLEAENQEVIGDPNPNFLMGIGNTFSYKNLTLSFLIDWRDGGDIWNGTKGALYYFGAHKDTDNNRFNNVTQVFNGVLESSYRGSETSPGDWVQNTQDVPLDINWHLGATGSGFTGPAEQFIEDGGWVRLRELTLAYSFPRSLFGNSGIGLDVSFTGRNLWLSTNYTGIDPETNLRGAANGQGFDYFNMPNTRSYVGAIRFSF